MIKRYLTLLLIGLAGLPVLGQGITDYYRLPDRQSQYSHLLARYGGPYTRDRWYVSVGGFVRTDRAKLDNSLNGLIASSRVISPGWSALIGWTYREKWGVEAGYAHMPIHSEITVGSGTFPYSFQYTNDGHGFVLRGRRMLFSTSGPWRRSGLWLSGGAWLVPNSGQTREPFALAGYTYERRSWEKLDTLRILGQTRLNNNPTVMAELGAEYNVRLNDNLDLGFSVRKTWGLGTSLTTDVGYSVNGQEIQQAQLRGTGSGMNYGFTLRYTYAMRRTLPKVLNVQGKQRIN